MHTRIRPLTLFLLLLTLSAGALAADPLDEGARAFRAKDYARAAKLWQPLAEKGNAIAQYDLGMLYQHGWGVKKDLEAARNWYYKSAMQNNAEAQYNLGLMYETAQGVFRSDLEAFKWWKYAASQGQPDAEYNLGVMYAYGYGTAQDWGMAIELWVRATKHGNKQAPAAMARAYRAGKFGLRKDPKLAAEWEAAAKRAAGMGNDSP